MKTVKSAASGTLKRISEHDTQEKEQKRKKKANRQKNKAHIS